MITFFSVLSFHKYILVICKVEKAKNKQKGWKSAGNSNVQGSVQNVEIGKKKNM